MRPGLAGTLVWPSSSDPQQVSVPASSNAQVWDPPAATSTTYPKSEGTILCPL